MVPPAPRSPLFPYTTLFRSATTPSEQKPEEKPAEPGLKESAEPSTVVLVGDADMIQDPLTVRELQAIGQRLRSEEHTSELQSRLHLVCRLLLEKKKKKFRTV